MPRPCVIVPLFPRAIRNESTFLVMNSLTETVSAVPPVSQLGSRALSLNPPLSPLLAGGVTPARLLGRLSPAEPHLPLFIHLSLLWLRPDAADHCGPGGGPLPRVTHLSSAFTAGLSASPLGRFMSRQLC